MSDKATPKRLNKTDTTANERQAKRRMMYMQMKATLIAIIASEDHKAAVTLARDGLDEKRVLRAMHMPQHVSAED